MKLEQKYPWAAHHLEAGTASARGESAWAASCPQPAAWSVMVTDASGELEMAVKRVVRRSRIRPSDMRPVRVHIPYGRAVAALGRLLHLQHRDPRSRPGPRN